MAKDQIRDSNIIVIGGSAGSLKPLFQILVSIDKSFPVPILIVLHRDPFGNSKLAEIIEMRAGMHVKEIDDKEMIAKGNIYVCPADYHALVESNRSFSLDYSEKIHFSRPSIDVSFISAADAYANKCCCILLSGANSDGADGLQYVKMRGGITIVQSPADAEVSYMPEQAINKSKPDHILDGESIGKLLLELKY